MMQWNWYIVTSSMGLCFIVAFSCILLQYKSSQYFWGKLKCSQQFFDIMEISEMRKATAKQTLLLYAIYACSALCALQCFLCHVLNDEEFCKYGMSACVIIYASAKTFLYGYLLERAVLVQNTQKPILPSFILSKLLPIYLFIYWLTYAICCPLYFKGKQINEIDNVNYNYSQLSACKFEHYLRELFIISSILDITHWIFLTFLFLAPTIKDIRNSKSNAFMNIESIKLFIKQMNIHILCTFICSATSAIFMNIMANAKVLGTQYAYLIWFGGNVDMMINCIASFFTDPNNRNYLYEKIFCHCCKCCQCCNCCHICCLFDIMECKCCCNVLTHYLIKNMTLSSNTIINDISFNGYNHNNDDNNDDDNDNDNNNDSDNDDSNNINNNNNDHKLEQENNNYNEPLMLNDAYSNSNDSLISIDENKSNSNNHNNNNNNHHYQNNNNHRQRSSMFSLLEMT